MTSGIVDGAGTARPYRLPAGRLEVDDLDRSRRAVSGCQTRSRVCHERSTGRPAGTRKPATGAEVGGGCSGRVPVSDRVEGWREEGGAGPNGPAPRRRLPKEVVHGLAHHGVARGGGRDPLEAEAHGERVVGGDDRAVRNPSALVRSKSLAFGGSPGGGPGTVQPSSPPRTTSTSRPAASRRRRGRREPLRRPFDRVRDRDLHLLPGVRVRCSATTAASRPSRPRLRSRSCRAGRRSSRPSASGSGFFPVRWTGRPGRRSPHASGAAEACRPVYRQSPSSARGSTMRKVVPRPGSDVAATLPSCAWATASTMASPSPTPPLSRLREASAR
jgi:hypothetical protein